MQDHYKTLGVTATADVGAIRAAYRRLVRETHPDMSDNPADHARFADVTEAYSVLSDPAKRRRYDAWRLLLMAKPVRRLAESLADPQKRGRFGGAVMNALRRLASAPDPRSGRDGDAVFLTRELSFSESFTGHSLRVEYDRRVLCSVCDGTGRATYEPCPVCHGHAEIPLAGGGVRKVCPRCGGEGVIGQGSCRACGGHGRVTLRETVTLRVPPGIESGTRLRAKGKGHQGRAGGRDGDLIVEMRTGGSLAFSRRDLDVITEKTIPLGTALRGGQIAVVLPDDTAIEVDIPAGVCPGAKLTVPGRGFHSPPTQRKGDLELHLDIYLPENMAPDGRQIAYRWFDAVQEGDAENAARLAATLKEHCEGLPCSDDSTAL